MLLHVVLLAGSSFLHSHHGGGLAPGDLPAEFHRHDFQLVDGGEEGLDFFDGCIGCRLERSRDALAPVRVDGSGGSVVSGAPNAERAASLEIVFPSLLPRAPPISLTA
jgi:hypothetical protein